MIELKQELEAKDGQDCEKLIGGLCLAIQPNQACILPARYWAEPITCGTNRDFHQRNAEVICWECAVERGIVDGTEQQYKESIESVIETKKP